MKLSEQLKLIENALKKSYPGVRFKVEGNWNAHVMHPVGFHIEYDKIDLNALGGKVSDIRSIVQNNNEYFAAQNFVITTKNVPHRDKVVAAYARRVHNASDDLLIELENMMADDTVRRDELVAKIVEFKKKKI